MFVLPALPNDTQAQAGLTLSSARLAETDHVASLLSHAVSRFGNEDFPDTTAPTARILSVVRLVDGGQRILVSAPMGLSIQLQASSDLAHWTVLAEAKVKAPAWDYLDLAATKSSVRFYRVLPLLTRRPE